MKRRNLLHTGIAAVLLLSTGACEDFKFGNAFLDKPFTTDITIDTVYAHKVYAEQALAEVYRSLPDYLPSGGRLCWGILEGMTDLGDAIKPNGIRSYYTGNVSSSTGDMPYILYEGTSSPSFGMSPMTGIRKAYIFGKCRPGTGYDRTREEYPKSGSKDDYSFPLFPDVTPLRRNALD